MTVNVDHTYFFPYIFLFRLFYVDVRARSIHRRLSVVRIKNKTKHKIKNKEQILAGESLKTSFQRTQTHTL